MVVLKITEGSVRHHIRKLKDEGTLIHVGPDKGGYWEINEKQENKVI